MKKSCKKVVVKKNKAQRIGVCILMLVLIIVLCIIVFSVPNSEKCLICLILSPIFFSILGILLYYQSWQIVFATNQIYKKVFFVTKKIYSYSQITDIVRDESYTEYEHILVTFKDGRKIMFRTTDENAYAAIKILCSHRSIRLGSGLNRGWVSNTGDGTMS